MLTATAEPTSVFVPNSTGLGIMKLVHGYFSFTKKTHNLISQDWLLEKLKEWHSIDISRSALNYNLAILRKEGMIETVCRHKRNPQDGSFVMQVTLYKMTAALKKFFSRLAAYFRRCKWVPSLRELKTRVGQAVGSVTNPEECDREYRAEMAKRKKRIGHKRKGKS